jgi:predicted phage terminase large subunit-like protein
MTRTPDQIIANAMRHPGAALAQLDRQACEGSLLEFVKMGWGSIEPGVDFTSGWAVGAMAEHLEAVTSGEIRRLLINVPPGSTKSMLTSVFWPAWEWGPKQLAHHRFICASVTQDLAVRDMVRSRDLMTREFYQEHWGEDFTFKGDVNAKIRYENNLSGWRQAIGVGGSLIGHRGDRIIIDDPHSKEGADSEVKREASLLWFSETLPTRLNDLDKSAIVVIMQRLHDRDISGLILAKELGYEHLCLPMEYEHDHPHKSTRFTDPRTEDGDLLWPERFSRKAVEELKQAFRSKGGSYAEAGQLQQRPVPRGGGMFKTADFEIVDKPAPASATRCRGWDLAASTGDRADWTVGAKMARDAQGTWWVEHIERFREGPGDVEAHILAVAQRDGPSVPVSIPQDPGQAGKAQVRALTAKLAGFNVRSSTETGDKATRATPLAAQVEGRNVKVVRGPWLDAMLAEMSLFPNGEHDDVVDALSRAFNDILRLGNRDSEWVPARIVHL